MILPKKEELENKDEMYLYETDVDGYGIFSTMRRIDKIIKLVDKHSRGKKVLDAGSAQGNIAALLAEEGYDAVALDLNQNFLNYAKKKREFGKISYVCANALNPPFKKNTFDAVILGELVEHIAYPEKLLQASKRCLKKGGLIIITTPNDHLFYGLLSGHKPLLFNLIDKKNRKLLLKRQFGPSGSNHLFVFDVSTLKKIVEEQGFKVITSGYINSAFINQVTYSFFKFLPKFFLIFLDSLITKTPFLREMLSMGLYIAAKNE